MRARKTKLIAAICTVALAIAANLPAQTAVPDSQSKPLGQVSSPNENRSAGANSDATLEISPRGGPTPPTETSPALIPNDSGDLGSSPQQELPPVPTSGPPSSMVSNSPQPPLPYLGVSVQRIESHSTPGRDIDGLEIVSVDPDSPAERAGLKGRGGMTTLGASGATAGALMAPLDIALMPLLKKAGQLGQTGDLIVAIDDRRVAGEADLETALGESKPGDTIYLTIVRLASGGAHKTIKIPVKLGSPTPLP
jgi:PDZ domain